MLSTAVFLADTATHENWVKAMSRKMGPIPNTKNESLCRQKKNMQHLVRLNLYEDLQQSKRSSQLSLELVYDERKFSS